MKIHYYINAWEEYLAVKEYPHTFLPRKGEEIIISANEIKKIYTVLQVRYDGDNIRILVQ